jgi:hypothetical protein
MHPQIVSSLRFGRFSKHLFVTLIALALVIGLAPVPATAGGPVCGDGVINPPETCDPPGTQCIGSPAGAFTCSISCNCTCGNGVVDPGEQCDPTSPGGGFVCVAGPCLPTCACPPTSTTTVTTSTSTTSTTRPDHFQCYELKPAAFTGSTVTVQDQFGAMTEQVRYPHRLCNPTNKNQEGIVDPTDHLAGYRTKAPRFTKRTNQTVVDQFGTLLLDVTRVDILMVPTSKDGVQQQPPLDHFQCYKVKRSKGAPKFVQRTASISNQFETVTVSLLRPKLLCAPANKNNEDPGAPSHPNHLLCYKTKNGPFAESTHTITNQFGLDEVRVIHRRELCVPALKNPQTPTTTSTSTTVQTTTSTSSTTATSTTSTTNTTSTLATTTTTSSTTTTTLYGSPSRAFLERVASLLD